jgi:ABC-type amino acid transport substrate-binding protein
LSTTSYSIFIGVYAKLIVQNALLFILWNLDNASRGMPMKNCRVWTLSAQLSDVLSYRAKRVFAVLGLACLGALCGNPAFAQQPTPQKAAGGTLTIDPAAIQQPWSGDLDGMVERRVIRVLTVNSKTMYFHDKGTQRGIVVDALRLFEDELNKKVAAENKLKNRKLKVQVVFIPVGRDELLPALAAGKGDIAAANLTITPERQKLVDFALAGLSNVSEVAVSGPASPKIASVDDLSGKEIFVRSTRNLRLKRNLR